jgi:tRNA (guanine37-N1)-methyltransferase
MLRFKNKQIKRLLKQFKDKDNDLTLVLDFVEENKRLDDAPFGGGPGVIVRYAPLSKSIESAKKRLPNAKVIYMSPQGQTLKQDFYEKTSFTELIIICGRYEGIDERIIDEYVDIELSVGDYILSGGEFGALIVIDNFIRQIPNVLNNKLSLEDSFSNNLLKYPQYTKPRSINGVKVPDILLSGNHKKINLWRLEQSVKITREKRPDLLDKKS